MAKSHKKEVINKDNLFKYKLFIISSLGNEVSNVNAACGSVGEGVSNTTTVTNNEQTLVLCLKVLVKLNLHIVEQPIPICIKCVLRSFQVTLLGGENLYTP